MQRRHFLKETGTLAFGISVFGSIRLSGDTYIGDTPTTTDILGPFYRPNAPVRTNINPTDYTGPAFHLNGTVYKQDGKTPYANSLVEIWQCDEHEVYDNASDGYKYRGSQRTNAKGEYHFITSHPVPYKIGAAIWRPAHIHIRVSGEGQQDLVTQIYFQGDEHLKKDAYASIQKASTRIMPVKKNNKSEESVTFDVVMAKEFKPSDSFFEKITGVYQIDNAKKDLCEFYRNGDSLFMKLNGQIMDVYLYAGNNEFVTAMNEKVKFEVKENGEVHVCLTLTNGKDCVEKGIKTFRY